MSIKGDDYINIFIIINIMRVLIFMSAIMASALAANQSII